MTDTELILSESRLARRLARLFEVECNGGFDRWPAAIVRQLIERRAAVVKDLLALDRMRRRSMASPGSPELDRALAQLARTVDGAQRQSRTNVEQIGADLRLRLGVGAPTGLCDFRGGQLLGKT